MKTTFFLIIAFAITMSSFAQEKNHSYDVQQALEVESLVPMFVTGGYHIGVGYRYKKFRVRASVINGGSYNAEPLGVNNSAKEFKRYYKTSPGIFLGYNVWRNLEIYSFLEAHRFEIEQKSTSLKKDIHSFDFGGGVGYQFFIGNHFYIQPAIHVYLRKSKSLDFDDVKYTIPNVDISPVFRIGYRLWSRN
ncbi:MAG: hypothetical protein ACK5M3_07970 [Dysgonomonas sp.]